MTGNISGAQTSLKIGYENKSVWNEPAESMTPSNATYFAAGQGVDFSVSRSNNKVRNFGIGSRNAESTSDLQFSGSLSINGSVSNAYWLLGAFGSVVDAGSDPYTHTYSEEDVLPSFTAISPTRFDTVENEVFQGCVVNQLTLTSAVNDVVKFSLDCPFRYSKITTDVEADVSDTQKVYTFAGGKIEAPTGEELAVLQNFDFTINNTVTLENGLGSRFAKSHTAKNREYNFSFTANISDYSLLKKMYGGDAPSTTNSELATLKLTFVNGDGHSIVIELAEVHFNEDTLPRNISETLKESITGWANRLSSAVYTNDTENSPQEA